MIYGGDFSSYETLTDIQAVTHNPGQPIDFIYLRAWTMYSDDQQFSARRKIMVNAYNDSGSTLWGAYGEVGYGPGSKPGDGQAANMWGLISAGGIEWQLPPWVCMEDEPAGIANGVTQYVPRLPLSTYLDTKVMPFIEYLEEKTGRLPCVYTGPNWLLYYLAPARNDPKYAKLWACPLALARYNNIPLPLTNPLNGLTQFYGQFAFSQYYGDHKNVPGIDKLDRDLWPGDRASLKAWAKDPAAGIPAYTPPSTPPKNYFAVVRSSSTNLRLRSSADTSTDGNILDPHFTPTATIKLMGPPIVTSSITWAAMDWDGLTAYFAVKQGANIYADVTEVLA